jgi:hypothetical protein
MYCQHCGAFLAANALTCTACGKPAQNQQVPPPAWQQSQYQQQPQYQYQPQYGPPAQKGYNIFAVLGFLLTLMPVVPFAGLVLSIVGWSQCNKSGEMGKGFAVAGVLLNIVGLVLIVLFGALFAVGLVRGVLSEIPTGEWYNGFAYVILGH